MTTAFAPYDVSYASRTPLISTTEYSSAPTAVDTSNLIPGGNAQAQLNSLQETIGRASSWCDQFCFGAWGCIAATAQIENARVWGSYRSTIPVHPRYWPVLEVRSLSYTNVPGGLINSNAASINPSSSIVIYPQEFEVIQTGVVNLGLGALSGIQPRVEYDVVYNYVAGWPNTTLAASVAAGATSIQPSVLTGIYPSTLLTIYDLPYDEPITVASTYVPGAATVPLTSPLQYNHSITATVTNLPPAIKQAAILATTAFIKQRGSGALVVADMGAITRQQTGFSQNAGSDWSQAQELLRPFAQRYVGW